MKPLLVQISNALIYSKKYTEFSERYRRIKIHRGHKKATSRMSDELDRYQEHPHEA